MTPPADPRPSVLDGLGARLVAVAVLVGVGAALLAIHWDDLFPPEPVAAADSDDPFVRCVTERHGQIDNMVSEGVANASQAELFKQRAEALCRAQNPAQ